MTDDRSRVGTHSCPKHYGNLQRSPTVLSGRRTVGTARTCFRGEKATLPPSLSSFRALAVGGV